MSSQFQQPHLPVKITTPLGENKLLVRGYSGEEELSRLFHYRLDLVSEDAQLTFANIVGKPVTLQIPQSSGDIHNINGVIGRFAQSGRDSRLVFYVADVYPWLWLLTFSADCKIFQNMSTPDIVKKVFSDLGFSAFKDSLTGTYQPREFCVQYRETAFAFVSRLMEEEGIFYFFTHDASSHTLVLADDPSAWLTCTALPSARCSGGADSYQADDIITESTFEEVVIPNQYKTDDYNFETPDTDLLATVSASGTDRTIYDFPGLHSQQSDGETIAGNRLSALELPGNRFTGTSHCRSFYAGAKFTLSGHYRADRNADYVIKSMRVSGNQDQYSNSFDAFPATATYRPPMITPRPHIPGSQTALVVGKSGEEIWTDQYGRIKVKFHWDQSSPKDETSSCWVRVSTPWAGKQWGSIQIPRIGQEVVVSFLEGNPDRPLITGSVYNASQTVPYALPDNQTRTTVKSNSSKGGSGFNEIRLEDKAGSEELFMQAQKDMNLVVLNDSTSTITKDETITVKGKRTMAITGDEAHTNQANFSSTVSGNFSLKVSGNITIEASGSVSIKAGTSFTNKAGTDMTNDAGTTLTNKAAASQTVDCGGMLTLKAGLVKIN